MVLDMRLAQTQAALAWLDRVDGDAAMAVERERLKVHSREDGALQESLARDEGETKR